MEIIEFDYERDTYFDEEELTYQGIKYFEESRGVTIYKVIDFITDFYEYNGIEGATSAYEAMVKAVESLPEEDKKNILLEIEEWTEEKFETVEDLVNNGYVGEVMDYIHHEMEHNQLKEWLEEGLLEANDFYAGIAGYSQWAFFIAHKTNDATYVKSVWDGENFYVVSRLDDRGDILDSMGFVYAEDADTLLSYVTDVIGDSPFVVVDNDIASMMDVPKVDKIKHTEYTFKVKE